MVFVGRSDREAYDNVHPGHGCLPFQHTAYLNMHVDI